MPTRDRERIELMTLSKIIHRMKLKQEAAVGPYWARILQMVELQGTQRDGIWTFWALRRNLAGSERGNVNEL